MTIRRGERLTGLGRFKSDASGIAAAKAALGGTRTSAIWLSLPSGLMLDKRLVLPLAAESELLRVLSYEMDRETPFSADEVWWSWQVIKRDRQRGQLELKLYLVPKGPIVALTEALGRAGLNPTEIEVPIGGGAQFQIALDHRRRRDGWSRGVAPLAAACVVLAAIAAIIPFVRQSIALGKVEARVAQLQPDVDRVQKLRGQMVGSAGSEAGPDILRVLAKTTEILPDDTHLTDLSLRQRKLSLSGQSAAAAKLIGAIAADPFFKDPAFSAAVTRVQGGKLDAFSINAEIRP